MTSKRTEVLNLDLINAAEKVSRTRDAKDFFQQEEQLLQYILGLDKEKARSTLREIQQGLELQSTKLSVKVIHYYFIVLSSIVARKLKHQSVLNEENACKFIATCFELIEGNLTEENTVEIGDELIEFFYYVMKEKEAPVLSHETVNGVIQYISDNVEKQLIVEEIAKLFNVSTSHLSRIFREYTGVTLIEYITIRKIEETQYYLRFTDHKISQISDRFHFCNQSYFTRVFKKYTGLTPRRFRKDLDGNYFQFDIKKDDSL